MRKNLRRERYGACSGERLPESGEDDQVGVQPDALDPAHAEEREAAVVL